ncbi:peptidoglycan-binding protein [Streptomyces roseirectus]|uniref:Peptidoglycan-binding protein n=1 Tax=Streptomyces roseirectus TaxID=2768066 RepID=A0A7H0II88_9ACTN|nr:peptidoglycan-binding protein [Streptomyces roseirectus]QNP72504.1 peptidoglycan-binding protein [Streptomyces roseirectus]
METPVFEEIDPASDCDCAGCVRRRLSGHGSGSGGGGRPALAVTPRAVIVVATASAATAALGAAHAAPALPAPHSTGRAVPAGDDPETPQGGAAPLHGPPGRPATPVKTPATTRADIIKRAKTWVTAKVPYSMTAYWTDGYRQDCSGFVSMAWNLPGNEWTGTLGRYGTKIAKDDLQPGDILLFHNPVDPQKGSHVVIFGGWTDYTHSYYIAYEQTRPGTRRQATPYAYWTHSDRYVAYRYTGVATGTTGVPGAQPDETTPFPGRAYFGPGANNAHVTLLGKMLVERGAKRFYATGPGPRWSDADRRATQAFQRAQGWKGTDADGIPGPDTWTLLVTGKGRDIVTGTPGPPAPAPAAPAFPGRAHFRPGAENPYVTRLGEQLVRKGYGRYYGTGPTPRWSDADRRAVEAFQRAQGWRGAAADGYPGPETWRRLFS